MTIAGPGPIAFRTARDTARLSPATSVPNLHFDRVEAGGDQFLCAARLAVTGS